MTLAEFKRILDEAGYPIAYSHFAPTKENPMPSPPYIVYLETYSSNFTADNKVFHKIPNIQVELYTLKKDLIAEGKLETVLDKFEIPYDSTEVYIPSEGLHQKLYEVRLI